MSPGVWPGPPAPAVAWASLLGDRVVPVCVCVRVCVRADTAVLSDGSGGGSGRGNTPGRRAGPERGPVGVASATAPSQGALAGSELGWGGHSAGPSMPPPPALLLWLPLVDPRPWTRAGPAVPSRAPGDTCEHTAAPCPPGPCPPQARPETVPCACPQAGSWALRSWAADRVLRGPTRPVRLSAAAGPGLPQQG